MNYAEFKFKNFKNENSSKKAMLPVWPSAASLFLGAIFAFKGLILWNTRKNLKIQDGKS